MEEFFILVLFAVMICACALAFILTMVALLNFQWLVALCTGIVCIAIVTTVCYLGDEL